MKLETLYHYCSTGTFAAILQTQSIWLSSLTLSNDSMEGQLVKETIIRLAKEDNLSDHICERLKESLAFLERTLGGLGFCLSEQGDLLSQWRGYADDAHGISIGFSKDYLEKLSRKAAAANKSGLTLQKVQYDAHEELVIGTYQKLKGLIEEGAFRTPSFSTILSPKNPEDILTEDKRTKNAHVKLIFQTLSLVPQLFKLKSPAFREEAEWRLVSLVAPDIDNDFSFRTVRDRVIPYRVFQLEELGTPCINEVILGPKNKTPPEVLKAMLKNAGLDTAKVKTSAATYI
nr:DUF2971 domain-containing protein [[Pseudomonas] sp. BICA1-14]